MQEITNLTLSSLEGLTYSRGIESTPQGEILTLDISLQQKSPAIPSPFTLSFEIPALDMYSVWNPASGGNLAAIRPNWGPNRTEASLASWMPLHALLSADGENRMVLALSDAYIPTEITTGIREETATLLCRVTFFTKPTSAITEYKATLRIDLRKIPFYEAVTDVVRWWEQDCGYTPAKVPDAAREPLDSLWYSFHQELEPEAILRECTAARKLGMKTCIIDDGWQTDDSSRGYAYCGDWEATPNKIPDVKALCDALHAIDMKLVLWYSVPFVGIHSKAYQRFKNMCLQGFRSETGDAYRLDPRYPEVREYLLNVYTTAQRDWGLDGFKLDFIDCFSLGEGDCEPDPRRDYTSLEDAVDRLMVDIRKALTKVNPEVLLEFRQTYIGPAIRKFGNMFRVGDCPNDPISNRLGILNMRLTSGNTPVHSDMLMWHPQETVTAAARELVSVLFAVPQISLKLENYPEEHRKLVETFLNFWITHREILLDGKLKVYHPECRYSLARAALEDSEVVVPYTERVISPEVKVTSVVNATDFDTLIVKNAVGRSWSTFDPLGQPVATGKVDAPLQEIPVPVCGYLYLI